MSDVYEFEGFVLDPKKRTLLWGGSPVRLTPKAFDILFFLVRNPNRVVSKHELMKAVWPDTFVEEGNLTVTVSVLRKTLAERSPDDRLIVTLARQGYQFTADVTVANRFDTPAAGSSNLPAPSIKATEQLSVDGLDPATQTESATAARLSSPHHTLWPRWVLVGVLSTVVLGASYLAWHRSQPAVPTGSPSRLAVLPCVNLTGDPRQEYLADGITEELISRLAQLDPHDLSVIARTSVMGYKHPGTPLDVIGRDLGVQRVLESSVRSSGGGRLRVTVQMIDIKSQSHLWTRDYDYQTGEILELEDDVARAVARQIQLRLTPRPLADAARSHAITPRAIDAYFRGYYLLNERPTTDSLVREAVGYFEQAIKLDSNYALAWVALSHARRRQAEFGFAPHEEAYRKARDAADWAIALDPNLSTAYENVAWIQMNHDRDWDGANASLQRALSLDPGDAGIITDASILSATLGRFDEALTEAQRAVELDPLNPAVENWRGSVFLALNRPQEAAASFRRTLELGNTFGTHVDLAMAYLADGRAQDALLESEKEQVPVWRLLGEALANYRLGRRRQSDSALAELTTWHQGDAAYQVAQVYAYRGETDHAFRWLERAAAQHDAGIANTIMDPLLSNLRSDPRYGVFLAKVHLPR